MKVRIVVCLLALMLAIPSLGAERSLVRLEGWVVDSYCGVKNAKAERAEDTVACHKKGAKLILVTADGTTYDLEDQERALLHVGEKVNIFGTVDENRNLKVGNYIGSDKDKKNGKKTGFALKKDPA